MTLETFRRLTVCLIIPNSIPEIPDAYNNNTKGRVEFTGRHRNTPNPNSKP